MSINLEDEVICDFFVSKKTKKIWNIELDLYDKLLDVCNRYNLNIFTFGGTLLGSIRHNGFIPWDDDMDLAMTREDFTKLCKISQHEFVFPYFFQYALSDRQYFCGYARLRNSETTGIIKHYSKRKFNNGIFIDIYIFDRLPNSKIKLKKQLRTIHFYSFLLENYYYFNSTNRITIILLPLIKFIKLFITYEKLYEKYISVCSRYNDNKESKVFGLLCNPAFLHYKFSEIEINNLVRHSFENRMVNIPSDYDGCLKIAYGNYMEYPPVEKAFR